MRNAKTGFTLIELLLVLVIIVMLISLIGPASQFIFRQVDRLTCQRHLGALTQAYMAYVSNNQQFPPLVDPSEFSNGTYRGWLPPQYNYLVVYNGSYRGGWGPLVWEGSVSSMDDLVCPRDKERHDDWWAVPSTGRNPLVIKREIEEGGTPTDTTRSSYGIRCYLYPWSPATVQDGVKISVDNGLEFGSGGVQAITACRISTHVDVLDRHEEGAPVGYLDGSVEFRTDRILWDPELNGWRLPDPQTGKVDFQLPSMMRQFMTDVWQELDKR